MRRTILILSWLLCVQAAWGWQSPRRPAPRDPDPLTYRLTPGQVLAFEITLTTDYGEELERFHGYAVAEVLTVSKSGEAEMNWLARLSYARRLKREARWHEIGGSEIWCGPKLRLDAKGERLGLVKNVNKQGLPTSLGVLRDLTRLVFVEMPISMTEPRHSSGGTTLVMSRPRGAGPQPITAGLLLNPMIKGFKSEESRAEPIAGTLAWIHCQIKAETREGAPQSWTYQSRSHFNPERGLIQETTGSYTLDQGGRKVVTKIEVALLTGAAHEAAVAKVASWRKNMPAELTGK